MELAVIRYKGYTFTHNPKELKITSQRKNYEYTSTCGEPVLQPTGEKCRVIKGEIQLYGDDAVDKFNILAKLYKQGGSGLLCLPQLGTLTVQFKELIFIAQPTPGVIVCGFVFTEIPSKKRNNEYYINHIIKEGENLWQIARQYETTVDALLLLNPQIKRPDELKTGEEVKVCLKYQYIRVNG